MGLLLFDMIRSEQIFNLKIFFSPPKQFFVSIAYMGNENGTFDPFFVGNLQFTFAISIESNSCVA